MSQLDPPGPYPPEEDYEPEGWKTGLAISFLFALVLVVIFGVMFAAGVIDRNTTTDTVLEEFE